MRRHDQVGMPDARGEHLLAATLKAGVADGGNFVDEIAIKLNGHGKPESQASSHSTRVGLHRCIEIVTKLGKVLHKVAHAVGVFTIDSSGEFDVVPPRHHRMKAATETERPRNADGPSHISCIWQFRACNN